MKLMKNLKAKAALLACLTAATAVPTSSANAGIIIGVAIPGIGSALVGLTITSAGFFWGIQSDDLNYWAAAMFVLDQDAHPEGLRSALEKRYPGIDSAVALELGQLISNKAAQLERNGQGLKEVVLTEAELGPVLQILEETGSDLGARLIQDLTRNSLK
jgi:hypothetical protein